MAGRVRMTIGGLMKLVLASALALAALPLIASLCSLRWFSPTMFCGPTCQGNIRQVSLALAQYLNDHGKYPPAVVTDALGRPLYSWRVLMLPYLDAPEIYNSYNFQQPWNGPDNFASSKTTLTVFVCPNSDSRLPDGRRCCAYALLVGPSTAYANGKPINGAALATLSSSTVAVVESSNLNLNWSEPRDLDTSSMSFQINDPTRPSISCNHGAANVALVDGTVEQIPSETPLELVRTLLDVHGDQKVKDEYWIWRR